MKNEKLVIIVINLDYPTIIIEIDSHYVPHISKYQENIQLFKWMNRLMNNE